MFYETTKSFNQYQRRMRVKGRGRQMIDACEGCNELHSDHIVDNQDPAQVTGNKCEDHRSQK